MLIFVEPIYLSLPSRLVTFLGSLFLSAGGPGIDYFQLLLLIEIFVGLLQLVSVWVWVFWFGLSLIFLPHPLSIYFCSFPACLAHRFWIRTFFCPQQTIFFHVWKKLLVLQMHVYNLVQPSCIYNKDSWFQSLSLIKVWRGRISGFSKVIWCFVMMVQRHSQNLTWGRVLICSIDGGSAFHFVLCS